MPLLIVLLLLCIGCSKKEAEETQAVVPVQVEAARRDSIRRMVEADAVVFPCDQAGITPKISAPVRAFYVNRGDHVRQGQLLAVLENRDLSAAALEGKAQFEQAQASYRSTTAATLPEDLAKAELDAQAAAQALDAANKLYTSRQQLFREGALAQRLVDEAQVAYVQARTQSENAHKHLEALRRVGNTEQLKAASAQLEAAKGHYASLEAQLSYSEIRSPLSGVVTDRPIYPGEMATAGTPLVTVMDVSQVIARANVPAAEAAALKVGDSATLRPTGGDALPGKVTVVSPAADPGSTTVQVWVRAANREERLRPGMAVRVAILAGTANDAVVVPPAALLPSAEGTAVVVVDAGSVAHQRKVEVGAREPDKVQVVSGVAPGDRVVIQGGLGLPDGAKVRIGQ